ncbi:unnamed protein product [Ambrosiozyma monospora]|uniref:Unnamed protein product n=1 Tax=Ambrosiozyma monospora TaxID=43982 RepID=A0ACB5UDN7_AMBMO|nr:unnamed protein product [Ambrosiozyma monospora]
MASIQKQRIADIILFQPNSLFDLRLSMSVELPFELDDEAYENFKKKVSLKREKDRISFIHQSTFTRFDLTKVKQNKQSRYELEMELNTPELLKGMRLVSDDPLYYSDLVQAFLDNGRVIVRQLSVHY